MALTDALVSRGRGRDLSPLLKRPERGERIVKALTIREDTPGSEEVRSDSGESSGTLNFMGQQWYLHLQGETLGPLVTGVVRTMLRQKRVEHYDFIWTNGMSRWTRICELDEFSGELPPYPSLPVPSPDATDSRETADPREDDQEEAPPAPPAVAKPDAPWRHNRCSPRVAMCGNVDIPNIGEFPLVNISETGLFVQASASPAVGTEVRLRISSSSLATTLEMTGVVIRAGAALERTGFAVEFTRVNPAHRRIISAAIVKSKPG